MFDSHKDTFEMAYTAILDFTFCWAQDSTPAALSTQAQITMASLGGIAVAVGIPVAGLTCPRYAVHS
jgi:hypothetical protein